MSRLNLLDYPPLELESVAESLGAPRYRGRQIATWLYAKGATDIGAMSDLPREFRAVLSERAEVAVPEIERRTPSQDGSQKLVLRLGDGARITHLVYMGMGEPLANYAATVQSLRILTDPKAFGFSPRRITVSTVGLVSGIEKLAKENLKVNLAISLHATSNQIRNRIMPVNKGFAIEELLEACRGFPVAFRQRITFEYVLLDRVNDSAEDARRLVRLLKGVRAKVNLIPFNDWEGSGFQRPPLQRILAFQSILLEAGIRTTVRWSKGEDIGAACGQLKEALTA